MTETHRIVEWLSKLVQIPSVGPENSGPRAGVPGEARIANALAGFFEQLGGEVVLQEVASGRPNVYGLWRHGTDYWIMVDVHTDTVGVETMDGNPFDGRCENGKVFGRGALDTKATLGIVLALLEHMQVQGKRLSSNLLICATVGEETGAGGARRCANWIREQGFRVEQLMVAEPTLCAPVYGHMGSMSVELEVLGSAGHSSQPELAKNAISAAAKLIIALDAECQRINSLRAAREMGQPKMSVTLINGGQASNSIPDQCKITLNRRLALGEKPDAVLAQLFEYAKRHCDLPLIKRYHRGVEAFYQSPDGRWIQQLAAWSNAVPVTVPYGTNMFSYRGLSRESVVFGPGDFKRAHGSVEWVEVSELEKAARVYEKWWGLA